MTRDELQRVLDLHGRAYETMLWLHNYSYAHPELLTEQTASALLEEEKSRQWARENVGRIPQRLRPAEDNVETFACLFASLFQTSFRVERRQTYGDPPHFAIVRTKDLEGHKDAFKPRGRHVSRPTKKKRRKELASLKRDALREIAPDVADERIDALLADADRADDVALWAYGFDLAARSYGRPHGPVGHLLWQELDQALRKNLTADIIWAARERLLSELA